MGIYYVNGKQHVDIDDNALAGIGALSVQDRLRALVGGGASTGAGTVALGRAGLGPSDSIAAKSSVAALIKASAPVAPVKVVAPTIQKSAAPDSGGVSREVLIGGAAVAVLGLGFLAYKLTR